MTERYQIKRVESSEELAQVFSQGLTELYQEIFADPPYEESFTKEEVQSYFELYFLSGIFLSCEDIESGEVIGFAAAIPLILEDVIAKLAQEYDFNPETDWYFADLGVKKSYRRQKLATQLVSQLIGEISGKQVIMRTSENNIASQRVNQQVGFELVEGMVQDVKQMRQDCSEQTDRRIFLSRKVAS
ncbi:MAG: GNAT family N-acetyltransferase [Candidatus Pacebacteria bacterium]|nr:GNAT family N-acetyltransferase [Candidatus Paceibacterota bacterium]